MVKMVVIFSCMLFLATSAYSDIYKYTDENGVICYTDAPYGRKTEEVMKEKKVKEKKLIDK